MSTPTTAFATQAHYNLNPYNRSLPGIAPLNLPRSPILPLPKSPASLLSNGVRSVVPLSPSICQSLDRAEANYAAMPTRMQTRGRTDGGRPADEPTRKRRRRDEPDWGTFYKNGLPQEIIVIEDSPEPAQTTNASPNSVTQPEGAPPAAKRRRRNDGGAHYDPVRDDSRSNNGSFTSSNSSATIGNNSTSTSLSSTSTATVSTSQTARPSRTRAAKRMEADTSRGLVYRPPKMPPKKASDVNVRVVRDTLHDKQAGVDDDDGHYIVVPDTHIANQYQIVKLLGQGTFGKVVKAHDRKGRKPVAVKIIRSVQKYRDASKIELRVLQTLKANDPDNQNRCIHFRDCFDFKGHICIVTDLLDISIFDFLKANTFVPFPNSHIQSIAKQLFISIAFLHDLNLIHTDLKPENILLRNSAYQTFTYNRYVPSSQTGNARHASQRKVLLDTEIRLIDFGSATFQDEYHSSVVSTRHYRAPEIILGLGWSYPCDIWSIGCILVELFTGDALFQTHDNLEHLAMMEAVCDARIDTSLVQQIQRQAQRHGSSNSALKYFNRRLKLDFPTNSTTRASRRFVKSMKRLPEIIPMNNMLLKHFLDLLAKIFVYDPKRRITAKEALQHSFFQVDAPLDDGTEAARIRLERARSSQETL